MSLGLREFCKLSHVVALTLLKVKILLDLNTLESARDVVPRLNDMPRELFDSVHSLVPRSPIISRNWALMEEPDHETDILEMELQAHQLYCIVHMINPHFWGLLFDLQSHLPQRPATYSRGNLDEAQLVLGFSYRAWVETRGALELIKEKIGSGEWVLPPGTTRTSKVPFVHNIKSAFPV